MADTRDASGVNTPSKCPIARWLIAPRCFPITSGSSFPREWEPSVS
jgi:hypothetical protein